MAVEMVPVAIGMNWPYQARFAAMATLYELPKTTLRDPTLVNCFCTSVAGIRVLQRISPIHGTAVGSERQRRSSKNCKPDADALVLILIWFA